MSKYNVMYYDEDGRAKSYLMLTCSREVAEKYRDKFNERYRKPYPNGKGYYASAKIVLMPE